jgi:hypothetical protein
LEDRKAVIENAAGKGDIRAEMNGKMEEMEGRQAEMGNWNK